LGTGKIKSLGKSAPSVNDTEAPLCKTEIRRVCLCLATEQNDSARHQVAWTDTWHTTGSRWQKEGENLVLRSVVFGGVDFMLFDWSRQGGWHVYGTDLEHPTALGCDTVSLGEYFPKQCNKNSVLNMWSWRWQR
jgi:hypothetical protein